MTPSVVNTVAACQLPAPPTIVLTFSHCGVFTLAPAAATAAGFVSLAVASLRFVARMGKDGNYVMGHSRWISGPGIVAVR